MLQAIHIAPNQKIEGQTFVGAQIQVDGGCAYAKCRFVNCTLNYAGVGPVQMDNNKFEDCRYQFVGPAGNTLNFLRVLYASGTSEMVEQMFQEIRSGKGIRTAPNPEKPATLQ